MSTTATIERPTVELPQIDGESAKAYRARLEYVMMGADRSLEKTRQRLAKDSPGYRRVLQEWSERYGWVQSAKDYDYVVASVAVQQAADAYRRDLEDHRKRYGDAGKALYQVAAKLLKQLDGLAGQVPKTIEGKDGKFYKVPGIELTPATLTVASRAMTIAADLEAHALRLGDILPKLDHDVLDHQ